MQTDAVTERTGGRSARVRKAALDAVADLLSERPSEEITTSEVARRSGVNRSTLHRRWGGVSGLLADLAFARLGESSPLPEATGDLRETLIEWASGVVEVLDSHPVGQSPFVSGLVRAVEHGGVIPPDVISARLESLEELLLREAERGCEVSLSARDLVEVVLLPIYGAKLLSIESLPGDLASRLVDRFMVLNHAASNS